MNTTNPRIGCVHGRFQPPHSDHLKYILAALAECDPILIGIAQPDAPKLDACEADPHRSQSADNPLNFLERVGAIRAMLLASGVSEKSFSFCKFPIDRPDELISVVPVNTICYTTIMGEWNVNKITTLKRIGFEVKVLWDKRGQKHIEGSNIRQLIRKGSIEWERDVHPATIEYLKANGLIDKISRASVLK